MAIALDNNKAIGAGFAALAGGALAQVMIRVLNWEWPGLVDEDTHAAIVTLSTAVVTYLGTWLTPHSEPVRKALADG